MNEQELKKKILAIINDPSLAGVDYKKISYIKGLLEEVVDVK